MTDNEIKIVIAEKCGWVRCMVRENEELIGIPPDHEKYVHIGGSNDWAFVPDFCNDLNAMHEVEKTLDEQDAKTYAWELYLAIKPSVTWLPRSPLHVYVLLHATARQRAEAFIKTVCPEKWKGDA